MRCVCGHTAHETTMCPCGCSLYEPDDGTYGPRHLYPITPTITRGTYG